MHKRLKVDSHLKQIYEYLNLRNREVVKADIINVTGNILFPRLQNIDNDKL